MQDDQTAQDATWLLVAFSTNHPGSRMVSTEAGMVGPLGRTDLLSQTGLMRSRPDSIGSAATTR